MPNIRQCDADRSNWCIPIIDFDGSDSEDHVAPLLYYHCDSFEIFPKNAQETILFGRFLKTGHGHHQMHSVPQTLHRQFFQKLKLLPCWLVAPLVCGLYSTRSSTAVESISKRLWKQLKHLLQFIPFYPAKSGIQIVHLNRQALAYSFLKIFRIIVQKKLKKRENRGTATCELRS